MSTMQSKRRPESGVEPSPQSPEGVSERLAGLLPEEALQEALKGLGPEEITGPGGLLTQLAGRVIESALGAELTGHLGHPPGGMPAGPNVRNGAGAKTVQTDLGPVRIRTPRDRDGSFEPRLVGKRQTRLAGLNDKILAQIDEIRRLNDHIGCNDPTTVLRVSVQQSLRDMAAWLVGLALGRQEIRRRG